MLNSDLKKILNIFLILMIAGIQSLAVNAFADSDCCHSTKKTDEKTSSCCSAEMPEENEIPSCSTFDLGSSSLDNCGCVHDNQKLDDTYTAGSSETIKVFQSSEILFSAEDDGINKQEFRNSSQNLKFNEPLFIINSAFLI